MRGGWRRGECIAGVYRGSVSRECIAGVYCVSRECIAGVYCVSHIVYRILCIAGVYLTALLTAPLLTHTSAPHDHNSKQTELPPTLSKAGPLANFKEQRLRTLDKENHVYTIEDEHGEKHEVEVSVTGLVKEWEKKKGRTFNEDAVIEGEIVEWVVE